MFAAPLVTSIHRFALDDGPGIRTTVFFKGCPLACAWCHNPECIRSSNEIVFHAERCIRCGTCAAACAAGAIRLDSTERVARESCTVCGDCAGVCPATALTLAGTAYPAETLLRLVLRDRVFFDTSGGGVTFSGGEPTLHMDFLAGLLRELKLRGVHTAIQTCGLFHLPAFVAGVLPYTDLVFFDLKLMDPGKHRKFTGAPNTVILENFRRLAALAKDKLVPRVPLIPRITDTPANLEAVAAFLGGLGYRHFERLRYNPGWVVKRQALCQTRAEVLEALCKSTFTTQ